MIPLLKGPPKSVISLTGIVWWLESFSGFLCLFRSQQQGLPASVPVSVLPTLECLVSLPQIIMPSVWFCIFSRNITNPHSACNKLYQWIARKKKAVNI